MFRELSSSLDIVKRFSLLPWIFNFFSQKTHLFANIKNVLKAIISTFFLRTKIR